jgi:hypothetical protein
MIVIVIVIVIVPGSVDQGGQGSFATGHVQPPETLYTTIQEAVNARVRGLNGGGLGKADPLDTHKGQPPSGGVTES